MYLPKMLDVFTKKEKYLFPPLGPPLLYTNGSKPCTTPLPVFVIFKFIYLGDLSKSVPKSSHIPSSGHVVFY